MENPVSYTHLDVYKRQVTDSMTTLNKYAAECCRNFEIHACTDVTGFSFLGHLHEMMDGQLSCHIYSKQIPVFEEALRLSLIHI